MLLLLACAVAPAPDAPVAVGLDAVVKADTGLPAALTGLQFDGAPPTNLLVVSLDTTRRDQIGYFSGADTTPNLDAVMRESVVLADHRSCSNWTAPSVTCATSGIDPVEEGFFPTGVYRTYLHDAAIPWVPDDLQTLAADLKTQGYATSFVTGNGVFSDNLSPGLVNGFDSVRKVLWQPAPTVTSFALPAARRVAAAGDPWYFHVHYIDPHGTYDAPPAYATDNDTWGPFPWDLDDPNVASGLVASWNLLGAGRRELAYLYLLTVYRAELRYWDESFGAFWQQLDAAGLLDDTLVVFWTDHGEQFGEHGEFYHGVSLHDQENRSTAFFWARNIVPGEWTGPTQHQDIPPTILSALGQPANPDHTGYVLGTAPEHRARFMFNYIVGWSQPDVGVVMDDLQLLYNYDGTKEFYDLAADPEETTDVYDAADPRVQRMWGQLRTRIALIQGQWPHLTPSNPRP